MDGVHDLGGKQGFGPIDTGPGDAVAQADWEYRMWAISRAGVLPGGVTIDWFRHGLERMVPTDYLGFSYYQKWVTNYLMLWIDDGAWSLEEVLTGSSVESAAPAAAIGIDDVLAKNRAANRSFETDAPGPPEFAVGDAVRTVRRVDAEHTRLPAYAAAARGAVIAHHGARLMADDGARGIERGEHLYTVAFKATALWGEAADPRDEVTLDLFESYLAPA